MGGKGVGLSSFCGRSFQSTLDVGRGEEPLGNAAGLDAVFTERVAVFTAIEC